jgi:hypothetical protein
VEIECKSPQGNKLYISSIDSNEYGIFQYQFNTTQNKVSEMGKWHFWGSSKYSGITDTAIFEITPSLHFQRPLNVFICYSKSDKTIVEQIAKQLKKQGVNPWIDEEELIPGHNWELEIENAIRKADLIITCFSIQSINKSGYINKELKIALDVADTRPEGTIFIIPLRIDDCNIPSSLNKWQRLNYFEPKGFEYLMRAVAFRAKELGLLLESLSS